MQVIKPVGQKLIVHELPQETTETESGILVMDLQLTNGEIVEVSDELSEVYKVGDVVIFPKETGIALPHYKKKTCLWLNAQTDVWGVVTENKEK